MLFIDRNWETGQVEGKMNGDKYNPRRKNASVCKTLETRVEVHLPTV